LSKVDEIKKNKVYCAEGDPDYGCAYIAAKTAKEAKQIALGCDVAQHLNNPYIELRVTRCWSIKETDFEGELDIEQINQLGLTWWECPECQSEDFDIINGSQYKCKNCGYEGEIPYI